MSHIQRGHFRWFTHEQYMQFCWQEYSMYTLCTPAGSCQTFPRCGQDMWAKALRAAARFREHSFIYDVDNPGELQLRIWIPSQ